MQKLVETGESVTLLKMMMTNELNFRSLIVAIDIAFIYQAFRKAFPVFSITYPAFSNRLYNS